MISGWWSFDVRAGFQRPAIESLLVVTAGVDMKVRLNLVLLTSLFVAAIIGCHSVAFAQNSISKEINGVKRIAVLPPRMDVYELRAGSSRLRISEWSEQAKDNLLAALVQEFKARNESGVEGVVIRDDELSENQKTELEQTNLLFDAVAASIARHVFGPEPFDHKVSDFQYSLGRETQKLNLKAADALLFVRGFDHISTAGRVGLQMASLVVAAAAGAYSGVLLMPPMGQVGTAGLMFTLVDAKTGDLLWFGSDGGAAGTDLRKSTSSAALTNSIFRKFPLGDPYVLNPPRNRDLDN